MINDLSSAIYLCAAVSKARIRNMDLRQVYTFDLHYKRVYNVNKSPHVEI